MRIIKFKPYIAISLTIIIYYTALYVISGTALIRSFLESFSYINRSNLIQFYFFVTAIGLSLIFFRGKLSEIGFRLPDFKIQLKSMKTALWVSFLETIFFFIWVILIVPKNSGGSHPAMNKGFLNTIISVWIIASFCEEVLYRGFLQSSLYPWKKYRFKKGRVNISLPVFIGALLFGLGHFCLLPAMGLMKTIPIVIGCFTTGLVAGYYREKSKSILPAYTSHLISNVIGSSPMWISVIVKAISS